MEEVTIEEICLEDLREILPEDIDEIMEWVFGDCVANEGSERIGECGVM